MYSAPAAPFLLRKREKLARKELQVVIRLVRVGRCCSRQCCGSQIGKTLHGTTITLAPARKMTNTISCVLRFAVISREVDEPR